MVSMMTREDTLLKLEKLMERLIRYSESNYKLTILKGEDRRDYKKDVKFVDHAIKLIKGDYVPDFSKENLKVIMATRLLKEKGIDEYLAIAKKVRESNNRIDFFLAGEIDKGNPSSIDKIPDS